LLRGQLLRGQTAEDIMSRYVEVNEGEGRPLVKVYSRRQARELFSMFSEVQTEVRQLTKDDFYFLGQLFPQRLVDVLGRRIGWNVIISARK